MDKDKLKSICEEVAAQYQKVYKDSLVSVLLYGSYARGEQQEGSDLDMVAIVTGDRITLQEQLKDVWDATNDILIEEGILVDAHVIPYDEFMHYKDFLPYYSNIEKEGIKIA